MSPVERHWHHDDPSSRYDVVGEDGRNIARYVAKIELDELVQRLEQAGEKFEVKPTAGKP